MSVYYKSTLYSIIIEKRTGQAQDTRETNSIGGVVYKYINNLNNTVYCVHLNMLNRKSYVVIEQMVTSNFETSN